MKRLCVIHRPTEKAVHLEFVRKCLERRAGSFLGKAEAAQAAREFFKAGRLPRCYVEMAENKLRQKLKAAIKEQFGIGESHDRGRVFHGLGLRAV